jgi:hypothetical protein
MWIKRLDVMMSDRIESNLFHIPPNQLPIYSNNIRFKRVGAYVFYIVCYLAKEYMIDSNGCLSQVVKILEHYTAALLSCSISFLILWDRHNEYPPRLD